MAGTSTTARSGPRGVVPTWVSEYRRSWLPTDIVAGLTVAALVVPEGIAYAQLAGVPPETAFYAAPIGLVLYALLGSSRQLVVAVSGAVSVLSATIVGQMADGGSEEFIALTAALAIATGLISMAAGLLKLGRIAQFFSESVLTGFIFGLALVIAVKQLPKMLGLEAEEGSFFERLWDVVRHLGDVNGTSALIGVGTLLVMVALEHWFERVPAALVVLIGGIMVGEVFDVADDEVEVVGEVPSGLVGPAIPDVAASDLGMLIVGGLAITVVSFAEAVGPARGFAAEHGYEMDDNKELVGIGGANLGAGFFQGFSIGSSLSKSAANDRAGANTPLSLIVAAAATALVALFLTGILENLPEPTLGAIVVVAVSGMMKVPKMQRLWQIRRRDFLFAITALVGVLLFDALPGLGIAVLLSLGAVVWRAATPNLATLGRRPGRIEFVGTAQHDDASAIEDLLIIRVDENLFFANAASIVGEVKARTAARDDPPVAVILDLQATVDIDVPACDELRELIEALADDGVPVALTHVRAAVRELFERTGVTEALGADRLFATNSDAVIAVRVRTGHTVTADDVAAEAATGLQNLIELSENPEVKRRLRRAIDALEHPEDPDS